MKWIFRSIWIVPALGWTGCLLFGGWWGWYAIASIAFLILYGIGILWLYDYTMQGVINSEMASAESDPLTEAGLDYENIIIKSSNGSPISGWYLQSDVSVEGNPIIIYSHGFSLSKEQLGAPSYKQFGYFLQKGYSILTFEYPLGSRDRSHIASCGIMERDDLTSVVRFAREKDHQFISVMGYSYGGGTALFTCVDAEHQEIDALVLDSSFIPVMNVFIDKFHHWMGYPRILSRVLLPVMWKRHLSISWQEHPMETVFTKSCETPILFWHGTEDADASYQLISQIHAKQRHPFTKLRTVEKGEHVALHEVVGEDEYNDDTFAWLEKVRRASRDQNTFDTQIM
ncbi:hypothetical protein D9X91_08560 [Falsibacillus albus]|uniref:Alpha/beta hydrolase n=2 Tax=Falsibacillus albus TaxID=2478915 RepID=A0A3L7K1U2_9BACI|nr:hypothetical protein D9X91_08560 [Falsibacillus albus]